MIYINLKQLLTLMGTYSLTPVLAFPRYESLVSNNMPITKLKL